MSSVETVDCVVAGAGVVGLAVARALAMSGREVLVVESEDAIGTHTSSRNSEVVHAGIYYPGGSAKARHCVNGKHALYDYCEKKAINHRRIGKLIVATTDDEVARLEDYLAQASLNGVNDLRWVDRDELGELEPHVVGVRALLSPSTGIIDSHEFMIALEGDLESSGGIVALGTRLAAGRVIDSGAELVFEGESEMTLSCRTFVNSAGLCAQAVARTLEGFPETQIPPIHYAKGHYYSLSGKVPFSRLVYPIASGGGLGVHVTLDLAGAARFGPDVVWIDDVDYSFDSVNRSRFVDAIRQYYPALEDDALQPGYTGIRPKLTARGEAAADFVVQGPTAHGVPGVVNLFGIESPGLTSALSIADEVLSLV